MSKEKVYIIGAGPGDPELITIKALKILKEADIILYDRLVNKEILKLAPKSAELINVGKEYGKQNIIQEKIFNMFLKYQNENKKIIRLKGGDPFIFGRGAEELEFLIKNNIEFEIIPGISSALSIPIQFNIPLTHRKYSSSIGIVTGHEDPAKEKKKVNFELLAKAVDTLVILMGLKNLSDIVKSLLEGGLPKKTPISIIEHGYFPDQKFLTATLETVINKTKDQEFNPPVLIIIGEVINLLANYRF
ncbi:MAG: uroporphyrinogen-III C-methyltransferase [Candidatus Helarchaeota archaeon]|nr:uroporphyrinogen-III C-methyltransferase [Candidatus Helarchaeota archaeon]